MRFLGFLISGGNRLLLSGLAAMGEPHTFGELQSPEFGGHRPADFPTGWAGRGRILGRRSDDRCVSQVIREGLTTTLLERVVTMQILSRF
jgi:hypothetical protein